MIKNLIMKLDLLKVLVQVADSKNFRDAAGALNLSQASVTNKLAALEKFYSAPLFVVEGKRKVLTPFGKALVAAARKNFADFDLSLREVERLFIESHETPLKVGCRPEVFSHIAGSLPHELNYSFVSLSGPQVAPAVLAGEIDIGFTARVPDSLNLLAKRAFKSHVRLVVRKELASSSQKPLWKNNGFLATTPALSYGEDGHLLIDLCRSRGIPFSALDIHFAADSWIILRELVVAGKGYAVIPNYISFESEIIEEPLPNSVCEHLDFYMVIRTAYKDVPVFKQLLKAQWPS